MKIFLDDKIIITEITVNTIITQDYVSGCTNTTFFTEQAEYKYFHFSIHQYL